MKKFVKMLVLGVVLGAALARCAVWLFETVPVDVPSSTIAITAYKDSVSTSESGCTGFHVGGGFYVTAAHCVRQEMWMTTIDGAVSPLHTEVIDYYNDSAVLTGPVLPTALSIADPNQLVWNQTLVAIGLPGWIDGTFWAEPTALLNASEYNGRPSLITQVVCAPGCSGGPLITESGEVAGSFVGFLANHFDSASESHYHRDYNRYVRSDVIARNLLLAEEHVINMKSCPLEIHEKEPDGALFP